MLLTVMLACTNQPKEVSTQNNKDSKENKVNVTPNKLMYAEVSGMTCEPGCGGSIRKNLKATGGVSKVEFDFIVGAEKQVCRIFFDNAKVSDAKITEVVQTINSEQYTLNILKTEDLTKK
jgi:copper chaperone CopZ